MTRHTLVASQITTTSKRKRHARHTVFAAHDHFVDELPIGYVHSVVEESFLFPVPVQLEHTPDQLVEQLAIWQTVGTRDSR